MPRAVAMQAYVDRCAALAPAGDAGPEGLADLRAQAGPCFPGCFEGKVALATAAEIEAETGNRVFPAAMDVRDGAAVVRALDAVEANVGVPGVVVNNAAGNFIAPSDRLSPNAFFTIVDTVLCGSAYVTLDVARRLRDASAAASKAMLDMIPANRAGVVDEIANLTAFLCSEYAWISGEIVTLDGGETVSTRASSTSSASGRNGSRAAMSMGPPLAPAELGARRARRPPGGFGGAPRGTFDARTLYEVDDGLGGFGRTRYVQRKAAQPAQRVSAFGSYVGSHPGRRADKGRVSSVGFQPERLIGGALGGGRDRRTQFALPLDACWRDDVGRVGALLDRGAAVDARELYGETQAVHVAKTPEQKRKTAQARTRRTARCGSRLRPPPGGDSHVRYWWRAALTAAKSSCAWFPRGDVLRVRRRGQRRGCAVVASWSASRRSFCCRWTWKFGA
ncbi:hypothetical protein JL722_14435 [Aureococcus anophagefferens]|nr:hypothetical protein JL722_14435 [Aureococcus anophagefferens]